MDVDSEIKMREKMAKADARTTKDDGKDRAVALAMKKSGTVTEVVVDDSDVGVEGRGNLPPADRPGAVAVRGPQYQGSGFGDMSVTADGGRGSGGGGGRGQGGVNDDGDLEEAPLKVDSYVVPESLSDEEIRKRILASTAHAEQLDKVEPSGGAPRGLSRRAAAWILVVVVVVAAAIAVGIAVPLSNQQANASSAQQPGPDVLATFKYLEYQQGIYAETRIVAGSRVTSGSLEQVDCRPKACRVSDTSCVVGEIYVPGCCAGADCPDETKCGEICPQAPDSCFLTDPTNVTCFQSECYECTQLHGEGIYVLQDYAYDIDCLEVGTAIRPDNGLAYKWAIACGPVTLGAVVEENRGLGEYQCMAARLGAGFSDETGGGGLLAFSNPCQFIALAECGCGPSDMYTFGLPAPNGTCQPDSGCPILCEGVGGGNEYAKNLCRSFPGNISWWEGKNAFNASQFIENVMPPDSKFEIYIKGVDP